MSIDLGHSLPFAPILRALALPAVLALIAASSVAAGGHPVLRADRDAPADSLDLPQTLAVSAAGEVYVGMRTDTASALIARFTDWGGRRDTWQTTDTIGGLAVGDDGTVYATLLDTDRIQGFTPALVPSTVNAWDAQGLRQPVATGLLGRAMGGAIYALVAPGVQAPDFVRYNPRGAEIARGQVEHSAYDIAVGGGAAGPDGVVYVADGGATAVGGGHLVRHTPDGQRLDAWDLPGEVRGIDTNAEGLVYAALVPYRNLIGFVHYYDPEGAALGRCELPGLPVDLAVDRRSGDFYVIVETRAHIRSVQRYGVDCALLDTWDEHLLNGFVTRTPPPATATADAGTGTATETGPAPTSSLTPTLLPTTPSPGSPTAMPTATRPPGAVYLPVGLDDVQAWDAWP